MSLEDWNNPLLNRRLLASLQTAIQDCHRAYENNAKSFAVILNELESLAVLLHEKLDLTDPNTEITARLETEVETENLQDVLPTGTEVAQKEVYVRLFHKEMPNLLIPDSSRDWVKPLFESIQTTEKHGLAVYGNEDDAQRSVKSEFYGYATVCIDAERDISEQREAKYDPNLNCPLLILAECELENITKFTYVDTVFEIKDAVMRRIDKGNGDEQV